MLDSPITLRTVLYAVLFVVFFPFSLLVVFPRTCLVILGIALLVPAMSGPTPKTTTQSVALSPEDERRGAWTELQAWCAGLTGKAENQCFERGPQ